MNLKLSLLTIIIVSMVFGSCIPTKRLVQTTTDRESRISATENIGIINDVCLQYDPLFKKEYVLLDDSRMAETFMISEAKKHLEQKGYTVGFTSSPFVGSFFPYDEKYRLSDEKREKIRTVTPPFYFDDYDSIDEHYLNAMLSVLNEVHYSAGNNLSPIFSSTPELKASLDTIADRTGQKKILFIVGNGKIIPVGKSIVKGVTVGLATTIISLGAFIIYAIDISYLNSKLVLIDLTTGEVLWSNSMQIAENYPNKENFYNGVWQRNLLYHFPVREGVVWNPKQKR